MKKVCLIELYNSHHECLYSQLLYLQQSGYEVTLVCDHRNVKQTECFDNLTKQTKYYDFRKMGSFIRLRRFLINEGFEMVIFNTAQSVRVARLLLFPFPSRISFVGTIHNLRKITDSFDQRIIFRKIKRYYLLADYLLPTFNSLAGKRMLKAQPYSSAIFPPLEPEVLEKKNGERWVVIPGSIESKRRDYDFLLEMAKHEKFPSSVRFVLLGNASKSEEGLAFVQKIKDLGLAEHFIWFEKFVPDQTFQAYIRASDYLLSLIHSEKGTEDYSVYKVSGTFVLAEAFNKILLCSRDFAKVPDFKYNAFFYNDIEHLIEFLKAPLPELKTSEIDIEKERKRYISLLD